MISTSKPIISMIFCRENDRKKKNKIVSVFFVFFLFGAFEIILNNVIIYHCGTSFLFPYTQVVH